jgi:hypothetical protein
LYNCIALARERKMAAVYPQLLNPELSLDVSKRNRAQLWTSVEDDLLRAAIARHGNHWDKVAREVPGRNRIQCASRWRKTLRVSFAKGPWSTEEDELLRQVVAENDDAAPQDRNWREIAKKVPNRNAKQCKERWTLHLDSSMNHGPWSEEEDTLLLTLHSEHGGKWSVLAKFMHGRNEHAIKARFISLQRKAAKVRSWTIGEDRIIVFNFLRHKQAVFAVESSRKMLSGRSKRQVTYRWNTLREKYPRIAELARLDSFLISENEVKLLVPHPSLSTEEDEKLTPARAKLIRRHKSSSSEPACSSSTIFNHRHKKPEVISSDMPTAFDMLNLGGSNRSMIVDFENIIPTNEILTIESVVFGNLVNNNGVAIQY